MIIQQQLYHSLRTDCSRSNQVGGVLDTLIYTGQNVAQDTTCSCC